MPMDTIEHLTALLMTDDMRDSLAELEHRAPGMGFALKVSFPGKRPVVFANAAMPDGPDAVIAESDVLANLSSPDLKLEMSILIHSSNELADDVRGELILASLQVLHLLDQEISVPVAA